MGLSLVAACGPSAQPSPTAAPARPAAEATKPAAAPATPAVAPPAAGAAAAASPAAAGAAASPAAAAKPGAMPWEIAGAGVIKGPLEGDARALTGAGATFPAPLYTKWFDEYNKLAGVQINYQSIGSGGGIKALTDNTVDFGASDAPMSDEQLNAVKADVLHVPMTLGAVVATYNIPETGQTKLKISGENLAAIYLGDIKKWNDPKLTADNPGVSLPDKDIVVVARSDGSGTSFIWTDYLSSVSDKWKSSVGKNTAVNWPTGLGAKGNEGVAGEVKQTTYALGYVELAYAIQNKLPFASIKNKSGQFVEPTLASTTAAAAAAAGNLAPDLRVSIVNPAGAEAYPIASFTWILVRKELSDPTKGQAVTRMLWWATHDGQKLSSELQYAPLPAEVVQKDEEKIKQVMAGGKAAFPDK
jgi:phosphate transport system substrate-binding protein